MNSQKADKTTKQDQTLSIEEEKHLWIFGNLKTTTTKTESLDVSTTMHIDIQQKTVGN